MKEHRARSIVPPGWSGSRRYWDSALPHLLARVPLIYALDLRWHGDSAAGAPPACTLPGCTVRRLAGDLYDFLRSDGLPTDVPVVLCGSSMGAAVIWALIETYGQSRLAGVVFVDQAPLQNRAPDWDLGSKGCYDAETLAGLQAALRRDLGAFADGNAACCLTKPIPEATLALLKAETLRCDPERLAALMADHTALDWRRLLPRISVPALSVFGSCSGCFPVEGLRTVARLVRGAEEFEMVGCNHWCYIEEPKARSLDAPCPNNISSGRRPCFLLRAWGMLCRCCYQQRAISCIFSLERRRFSQKGWPTSFGISALATDDDDAGCNGVEGIDNNKQRGAAAAGGGGTTGEGGGCWLLRRSCCFSCWQQQRWRGAMVAAPTQRFVAAAAVR